MRRLLLAASLAVLSAGQAHAFDESTHDGFLSETVRSRSTLYSTGKQYIHEHSLRAYA